MSDFTIKAGDRDPPIEATLERDGSAFDLTNTTVSFVMGSTRDTPVVDAQATIVDATAGTVRYEWAAGDTDTPGAYNSEFVVEDANGIETTFPDDGYVTVYIHEDVQRA